MVGKRKKKISDFIHLYKSCDAIAIKLINHFHILSGTDMRMGDDHKTKQFLEAKPQGSRPIGRPRVTWEEKVIEDATKRAKRSCVFCQPIERPTRCRSRTVP
jgi:hypothetical protein